jgi:hypothetical protein
VILHRAGRKLHAEIAIPAASFVRAVAFDVSQPEDVDVNEILFPTPLHQLELCTMRLGLR